MKIINKISLRLILGIAGLVLALLITLIFFEHIQLEGTTLAMDWKGLWVGLRRGLEYGNATGLRIPPWSALIVLPLGWLPFNTSWGVLTYITMVTLLFSVPRVNSRWMFLFSTLVLIISFPALRVVADGNFEVLVIAGCLLIGFGVSKQNALALILGILLATSKIQQTWLLLLLLPFILRRQLRNNTVILTIAGLALVCVPSLLWKGGEWLNAVFAIQEQGSQMDSSLWATSTHLGIPFALAVFLGFGLVMATGVVIWKSPKQLSR